MKKYFLIAVAFIAILMSSCNESPYINSPGDNSYNYPDIPTWVPDTNGTVISVDEAYAIGLTLNEDEKSAKAYKISGKITEIVTKAEDITSGKYSAISFYMSDGGEQVIEAYMTNNVNNRPFHDPSEIPAVGTNVTVQGRLELYNNNGKKIVELTDSYIVRIEN